MALFFLFVLMALYIPPIMYIVLPDRMFQLLEGEYLPPDGVNLGANILVKLLLYLLLCLLTLRFQCYSFLFLMLVSDHVEKSLMFLFCGLS